MKRVLTFCLGLLALAAASLTLAAAAGAVVDQPSSDTGPNGEKAEATMSLTPKSGSLYQGGLVPADWSMVAKVTAPYTGPTQDVYPLNEIRLKLPTDMSFNPDPKMPVCTDAMIGPGTNMSQIPTEVIKLCPKSVIGNGTAHMYLGHKNLPNGPGLKDPVLIVYNAGYENGLPKIKIHGFSKGTGVGIFIQGVLKADGTLILKIPQLSSDSSVGYMNLNIPGPEPVKYNLKSVPESVGQDPNYLQAKCSTGTWNMTSEFVLGTRDTNSQPISDRYPVDAPDFTESCVGKAGKPPVAGKAKIGKVTVKGAAKAKVKKSVSYKVTVKNTGKATATGVKVTAAGKGAKGSANVGSIPAGKSKTVKVKVKFTKKGKSKVTFTAKSKNGGSKKAVKTVTVK